jgi:DNA topoisomerase-1
MIKRGVKSGAFYYTHNNKTVDKNTLERIRRLHIPPRWTDVQITTDETSYLQVTGFDGKKQQYIYHPLWITLSKMEKYKRLGLFAKKLPRLVAHINSTLHKPNLGSKEHLILLIFKILLLTHSRIGNDCYAEDNDTYGLTTLLKKHVRFAGDETFIAYVGKKDVKQHLSFNDRATTNILRKLCGIPGDRLFKTTDGEPIKSIDVNNYLKTFTNEAFTCKDFRTYASNALFLKILRGKPLPASETDAKRTVSECYNEVAEYLGHTKTISKSSYVIPLIGEMYLENPALFRKNKPTLCDVCLI